MLRVYEVQYLRDWTRAVRLDEYSYLARSTRLLGWGGLSWARRYWQVRA